MLTRRECCTAISSPTTLCWESAGRCFWWTGAWREKNMYGKKSMGIQRSTYLIDAHGVVARVWKKVSVDGHDEQVLEALN